MCLVDEDLTVKRLISSVAFCIRQCTLNLVNCKLCLYIVCILCVTHWPQNVSDYISLNLYLRRKHIQTFRKLYEFVVLLNAYLFDANITFGATVLKVCNLLCAVQFLRPRLRLVLDREELEIIPVQISSVVMHGFSLDL